MLAAALCIAAATTPRGNTFPDQQVADPFEAFFDAKEKGPGIHKWTSYFPAYYRHLSKYIGRPDVKLVEIGIESGGSLQMWRKVMGPGLRLYGVDVEPFTKRSEANDPTNRTRVFIGDQGSAAFWEAFYAEVGSIDILIDDGSHFPEHIMLTLTMALPRLRPGGVVLIEDVHGIANPVLPRVLQFFYGLHTHPDFDPDGLTPTAQAEAQRVQSTVDSLHYYPYGARQPPPPPARPIIRTNPWRPLCSPSPPLSPLLSHLRTLALYLCAPSLLFLL